MVPLGHAYGGSDGKASACNAGDLGSIPGLGRSPREGNGNSLQYSCLENSMDRETLSATVHGVAKSRTRLSNFTSWFLCTVLKDLPDRKKEGGKLRFEKKQSLAQLDPPGLRVFSKFFEN